MKLNIKIKNNNNNKNKKILGNKQLYENGLIFQLTYYLIIY